MVASVVEEIILQLVNLGQLYDGKKGQDSFFPKFYVGIVLVNLLPRWIHRHVFVVPSMYSLVRIILLTVGLFLDRAARVGIGERGMVEPCIQIFLQDHVKLSHASVS